MQYQKDDRKGYYAVIGLPPDADEDQLKAAYRRRAMQLHPDRNPGPDATQQFQFLNEAYAVLSDPALRAEYDQGGDEAELEDPVPAEIPAPILCSVCAKISAQPRIVIFKSVKSFLVVTIRKPIAGVFCSDCAQKQSLKASATSWLLGWWGFPWGPIYTAQALIGNMFGGTEPPLDNAKMLGYQAYYFYRTGRSDIAQSIAESAIKFCKKIPETFAKKGAVESERDALIDNLNAFISALGNVGKAKKLKSSWGMIHRRFFVHLGAIAAVGGSVALGLANVPVGHSSPPRAPMPYSSQSLPSTANGAQVAAAQPTVANREVQKVVPNRPPYVRPKMAPNGRPWPTKAGYLAGEPQTHTSGHSELTIDNKRNTSDVQLKLVALEGSLARPARQIFIPAHGQFTIKNLTTGSYDVRYRDLTSGGLSRSESMILTESTTQRGIQYSSFTLTLYKVANGNATTYSLAEDEF
jgi:hypothetical protein